MVIISDVKGRYTYWLPTFTFTVHNEAPLQELFFLCWNKTGKEKGLPIFHPPYRPRGRRKNFILLLRCMVATVPLFPLPRTQGLLRYLVVWTISVERPEETAVCLEDKTNSITTKPKG